MMWSFINQVGLATGSLDFTNDLSLLLIGLVSVVWLCAGMIVWMAISHSLSRARMAVDHVVSPTAEQQDAA